MTRLLPDGLHDEIGSVAEEDGPEAAYTIDVLVSIHVPHPRSLRPFGEDGVDDLFEGQFEAGDGPWIGEMSPVGRGDLLGGLRPGFIV